MMAICQCLVQEEQVSAEAEAALREDMTAFAQGHFGYKPKYNWTVVGKGDGFTEAKPSNSVIVSMPANRSMPVTEREPLLRELGDLWMKHTGLTGDEVVTVIRDPA